MSPVTLFNAESAVPLPPAPTIDQLLARLARGHLSTQNEEYRELKSALCESK